jgi:taurine transport system substrate-binding protein
MADFGFRMTMQHLGVDTSEITIVDQEPADAAVSLIDGAVTMACGYGANSLEKMKQVGSSMLTSAEKTAAGITSFDIVSVTEKFAQEHPDMVRTFIEVTAEANAKFSADQSKIDVIAKDAGMTVDATKTQMAGFSFPTVAEQKADYFSSDGVARSMLAFMGNMFATDDTPALADYNVTIDTSFLD